WVGPGLDRWLARGHALGACVLEALAFHRAQDGRGPHAARVVDALDALRIALLHDARGAGGGVDDEVGRLGPRRRVVDVRPDELDLPGLERRNQRAEIEPDQLRTEPEALHSPVAQVRMLA